MSKIDKIKAIVDDTQFELTKIDKLLLTNVIV